MTIFSGRFWNSVISLDRRVAAASKEYDSAVARFRVSRDLLSPGAHAEFELELFEALAELRSALRDLRSFQERNGVQ